MTKLIQVYVASTEDWTSIEVPRKATPIRAELPGGGEGPVTYRTYWEVPDSAWSGNETYLIRRGEFSYPYPGGDEPPSEELPEYVTSESGLPDSTVLFIGDSPGFFWLYRDSYNDGDGYPPNQP